VGKQSFGRKQTYSSNLNSNLFFNRSAGKGASVGIGKNLHQIVGHQLAPPAQQIQRGQGFPRACRATYKDTHAVNRNEDTLNLDSFHFSLHTTAQRVDQLRVVNMA
jgi:hypothetical protein